MRMLLAAIILSVTCAQAQAQEAPLQGWRIKADMKPQVEEFIKSSPSLEDMRTGTMTEDMVYAVNAPDSRMMRVTELLACLSLSNSGSDMEVDSGGGYDIAIYGVQFPGGTWDVSLRLREVEQIDMLDKRTVYVVDRLIVGTLRMRDRNQKLTAVHNMAEACFSKS